MPLAGEGERVRAAANRSEPDSGGHSDAGGHSGGKIRAGPGQGGGGGDMVGREGEGRFGQAPDKAEEEEI
eukprot:18912-Prorocentrum_minimum.AAC.1